MNQLNVWPIKTGLSKRAERRKCALLATSLVVGLGLPGANALAQTVTVNCPGDSIQALLNLAPPAIKSGTIIINGTCTENVLVTLDNATLSGGASGTVDGTITVDGARRVVFDNLTVTGSGNGIIGTNNAAFRVTNSTISNNNQHGVELKQGAIGQIINSTISDNGFSGVLATIGATVTLTNSTISGNAAHGVFVNDGSVARFNGGNSVTSSAPNFNVGAAVSVYRSSDVHFRGTNSIVNTAPTFVSPGDSTSAGAFALDVEQHSAVRQDGGHTTYVGNIESFNLTTVDLRDTDITGGVFVDGLDANVRLRDQGTIPGNITVKGYISLFGRLSIRSGTSPQPATINGFIDCNGGPTPRGGDVTFVFSDGSPAPADFRNCN
jgi:hypothetical protein